MDKQEPKPFICWEIIADFEVVGQQYKKGQTGHGFPGKDYKTLEKFVQDLNEKYRGRMRHWIEWTE